VASALLRVSGAEAEAFVAACIGTVRWVGTSPFRPLHKRRNWFVGVQRVRADAETPGLRDEDIRCQTLRASGPGGQHVNKTDSAVRATHLPTGLTSLSQDQRSQFANKKIARLKLAMLLEDQRQAHEAGGKRALWDRNRELERGNSVRTYEGERFRRR
jgi:peptide chain release factor